MIPPVKPGKTNEARIQRNREAKARRFVSHFYGKMREAGVANPEADKDAIEKALALVRNASIEQWVKLAESMTEENKKNGFNRKEEPPSGATFELIVTQLETAIKNVHYQLCRCGAMRDDPTDGMCRRCQLKDIAEGLREQGAASGNNNLANLATHFDADAEQP